MTAYAKIEVCKCIYLNYASVEDFRSARDIQRSNPNWNGAPRFDCALISAGATKFSPVRLQLIFRCKLSDKTTLGLVAATQFSRSAWTGINTRWTGCRIFDEQNALVIMRPDDLVRGALVCPAFGSPVRYRAHFLIDCVDGDMFLCLNGLAILLKKYNVDRGEL